MLLISAIRFLGIGYMRLLAFKPQKHLSNHTTSQLMETTHCSTYILETTTAPSLTFCTKLGFKHHPPHPLR